MSHKLFHAITLLICCGVCCEPVGRLKASDDSRENSERNEDAVLNCLRPLTALSHKAIRIYYRADCKPIKDFNADAPVPFPFAKVRRPSTNKASLEVVREIFMNDEKVRVTEDDAAIRIWIGQVPTDLLRAKIRRLAFSPSARYNHRVAVGTLRDSEEVEAATRKLSITLVPGTGGLVSEPQKGLPHLPAAMKNVTVDHVLDEVAKTFHEVVVYGVCSEPTTATGEKFVWID